MRKKPQKKSPDTYVVNNENIRAENIRLIDSNGGQVGIVSRIRALEIAKEQELDLVLISSPNIQPAVCKIIDLDKYRYQLMKKKQKAQKKQKKVDLKEIRLRPNISLNDLQIKTRRAREFLEEKNKVRLNIQFVGRESLHAEKGIQIIQQVIEQLSDVGKIEQEMKRDNRKIIAVLAPNK